jgi:hypothetical protein
MPSLSRLAAYWGTSLPTNPSHRLPARSLLAGSLCAAAHVCSPSRDSMRFSMRSNPTYKSPTTNAILQHNAACPPLCFVLLRFPPAHRMPPSIMPLPKRTHALPLSDRPRFPRGGAPNGVCVGACLPSFFPIKLPLHFNSSRRFAPPDSQLSPARQSALLVFNY